MPDTGQAGVEGVIEDVKGKAKEVAGEVIGDRRLEDEGEAQQKKAEAQRDVAENEAEAKEARAEAKEHEKVQKAHQ